jgi:beta-D-xylosidase 4
MHFFITVSLLLLSAGHIHAAAVTSSTCLPAYSASTTFVGCFTDTVTPGTLNGAELADSTENTPEFCANLCGLSGYAYSGVEFAEQCFCSHQAPIDWGANSGTRVDVSECNTTCPGNSSEFCGGSSR